MLKSHKKKIEKVALIEVDGSHDECLLTQISALKQANIHVTLICTQAIRDRNSNFEALVDAFLIVDVTQKHKLIVHTISNYLKNEAFDTAVFNTAQGAKVRDISLKLLFSKITLIGIIHTTRKFEGSTTQKIINLKVKKYFLLSEFLFKKVKPPRGILVDYFYPIRFPEFNTPRLKNETLTISIVGGVETRRKDLDGFIEMVKTTTAENIQFVFLGKSDPNSSEVLELKAALQSNGLINRVKLYDSFVSQEEFDAQLKQTDALLPLVHPDTPSADQYFKNQISGAVNVGFGYNIPLLIHSTYEKVNELQHRAIFYDLNTFSSVISNCKPQLVSIEEWMKNDVEMKNDIQEKRYLDFFDYLK